MAEIDTEKTMVINEERTKEVDDEDVESTTIVENNPKAMEEGETGDRAPDVKSM